MLVVAPEREQANAVGAQVATARTQLASAEGQLANARSSESQYTAAYSSVVSLGKAVPPSEEVPSLILQLARASNQKSVEFASIATGTGSGSSTSPASSVAATAGFTQMPFTFIFSGSFFDLEHLFQQLTSFTDRTAAGQLRVSGRLLTIQSVKLAPAVSGATAGQSVGSELTGTITATAYVLPGGQGLTGGASSVSPAGASAPAASTTGASSSPTAPAIVKANP